MEKQRTGGITLINHHGDEWYYIDSGYYLAAFIVSEDKIIVDAAPIIKWLIGKKFDYVVNYCSHKQFKLEKL